MGVDETVAKAPNFVFPEEPEFDGKSGEPIWIELEAENPEHPTLRYEPERVQVQGVVVGLMRRYR